MILIENLWKRRKAISRYRNAYKRAKTFNMTQTKKIISLKLNSRLYLCMLAIYNIRSMD